jgi:hypothetical protein
MKWLYRLLYLVGFILEVVVPILMVGTVSPLIHGTPKEGLTAVGIICVAVFAFILVGKLKGKVREWKKGVLRALLLAVLKLIPVIVFCIVLNFVAPFILRLKDYAWRIIPIIVIGLGFEVVAEVLEANEVA